MAEDRIDTIHDEDLGDEALDERHGEKFSAMSNGGMCGVPRIGRP